MHHARTAILLLGLLWTTPGALAGDCEGDDVHEAILALVGAVEDDDETRLGRLMSPRMLENASAERLLARLRSRRFHQFRELHWNRARISGPIARVEGLGTLADGDRRWVNLRWVRRADGWRLASMGIEPADVIDEPAAVDMPDLEAIRSILGATLAALIDGVNAQRFDRLHASMVGHADEQFPLPAFNASLLALVGQRDFTVAAKLDPVLDVPPHIDDRALLWLEGHYPTEPPLRFRHAYQNERGRWRLLKFELDPRQAD